MRSIHDLLLKQQDTVTDHFPWGRLTWYARRSINGAEITLGFCHIKPGMENTMHLHPNCDEVLCVIEGTILHRLGGEEAVMNKGDSLLVPQGVLHNALNIGQRETVLSIAFTAGERMTENE